MVQAEQPRDQAGEQACRREQASPAISAALPALSAALPKLPACLSVRMCWLNPGSTAYLEDVSTLAAKTDA
jgi:hypothetical protein